MTPFSSSGRIIVSRSRGTITDSLSDPFSFLFLCHLQPQEEEKQAPVLYRTRIAPFASLVVTIVISPLARVLEIDPVLMFLVFSTNETNEQC